MSPDRIFRDVSECITRGLSVTTDLDDAFQKSRARNLRGTCICQISLDDGAGYIEQTGTPPHHTWWPLAAFDILANCKVAE